MGEEPRPGPGRRWSSLEGSSPGLRALVQWLRDLSAESRLGVPEMARQVAYSRTVIYDRLSGARRPGWDFVEAFVSACAGDDAHGREVLLAHAESLWRAAGEAGARSATGRTPVVVPQGAEISPEPTGWKSHRRLLLGAVPVASAGIVAVAILIWQSAPETSERPVRSAMPETGRPGSLVPGDASRFVADVTVPDGTWVTVGRRFVKTWRIQNTGDVEWRSRYLTRQGVAEGSGICRSAQRQTIPTTAPGRVVDISVTLTAPSLPGSCRVDWKMTDAQGHLYFPNLSGVYVIVNIADTP
jgi:Ig-like domain from next to BRCA1 gene